MDFLGGHRLGLNDGFRFFVADNLQDDFARLRRRACPMHFRAARLDFRGELDQIFVQMIERVPLGFGGGLARGFPALKRRLAPVAGDLVIAQRRADDLAMAQIARHHARVFQKFCDKSHAGKILTTDETRINTPPFLFNG